MHTIERRLARLEQRYAKPEGLEECTDVELADLVIALTQLTIDDNNTAPEERQKLISEKCRNCWRSGQRPNGIRAMTVGHRGRWSEEQIVTMIPPYPWN